MMHNQEVKAVETSEGSSDTPLGIETAVISLHPKSKYSSNFIQTPLGIEMLTRINHEHL